VRVGEAEACRRYRLWRNSSSIRGFKQFLQWEVAWITEIRIVMRRKKPSEQRSESL
jgi:hypothetical protein